MTTSTQEQLTQTVDDDLTTVESDLISYLTETIGELMRQQSVPGLNIAVRRGDRLLWDAGFGYADYAEGRPMTPDTIFRSGSMGKTYVAVGIMKLVEQGRLALDQPINDVLDFEVNNPLGDRAVTVEDLMTHRSGLLTNGAHSSMQPPPPLNDHLRELFTNGTNDFWNMGLPLFSEKVGTTFQYSNTGLALLGLLIQRANTDGLTYGQFLQKNLIEPLGHTSTYAPDGRYEDPAQVPQHIQDRVSTGYAGFGTLNIKTPRIWFKDFPAGLILSIPREHSRVLRMMMNGGELDGVRILERSTVEDMLTRRAARTGGPAAADVHVGLLWMMGNLDTMTFWFGHGGAHMYGWQHEYRGYPHLDLAVSVNTNRWDVGNTFSPGQPYIASQVGDLAGRYVAAREKDGKTPPTTSWAWKRSYVLGLCMRCAVNGYLSIPTNLDDARVEAMVADVNAGSVGLWDEDGFRAGVRALDGIQFTLESVERFLASDACALNKSELDAVWRDCGGFGTSSLPMDEAMRAMYERR